MQYVNETLTWYPLILFPMNIFIGMSKIIIAIPASTEGPKIFHSIAKATMIWKGPDQSIFRYVMMSINF